MDRRNFIKKTLNVVTVGVAAVTVGSTVVNEVNKSFSEAHLKQYFTRSYGRVYRGAEGDLITADLRNTTAVEMDILGRLKGNGVLKFIKERNIPFKINAYKK